jgi:hypothetical protein
MTFNQWWGSLKWSYAARIFMEPTGRLFAEMAWNAAVRAEREACAKVCDEMEQQAEGTECCKWPTPADCAYAIRVRGQA